MTTPTRTLDVDYLVVGAGATGMAFTDALVDHSGATVALVDRRPGVGGHWREAYPFVQLHQASTFYGVASTVLGGGRVQADGPEAGLLERAGQPTIQAYYESVLVERLLGSGRVELLAGCDYVGDGVVVEQDGGAAYVVGERTRLVDARYLAPRIPAETPPRFAVGEGVRVVAVNDLPAEHERSGVPGQHVVVGSGKTATDACVWLLRHGVDPDTICWVRPRDPWMLNRALIQPKPEVYLGMVAEMMRLASDAPSLDALFLRLEDAGIMLRVDPSVTPSMAKAPTLGTWELDLLRSIDDVVRLGHVQSVSRGRLHLDGGSVAIADDALVVNCAADGLRTRPSLPIWGPEAITPQPVRAGFPCFGAAITGYVEATRPAGPDGDAEKNRLCPPSAYGNSLVDWARMNVVGMRNSASFGSEPDIKDWSDRVALNPARVSPDHPGSPALDDARARLAEHAGPGVARLAALAGLTSPAPDGA
ncbi:Pyridine nucleotide-disulphide oxidoreductase [Nocardioides scoriae]|uniref:Pyridine nucleotide-disulphide oxidoreductase n=1 Tax=Nocardioides scoriae TaxID=642780 RepID=A0A1H1LZI4_9ACTN|nr:NAD(P)-binding protein [Nocardioides scoriae]SDR80018.1 Pyridine nucleotide-disulphide oxidoreductase [Nocardioides scoriae]